MSEDNFEDDPEYERLQMQRKMDEMRTFITDHIPLLWKSYYDKLQKAGFNESQAFSLLKVYIISQGTNGTHLKD